MEDCLHNMERDCDLVGYEERVKKLKKSKEICDRPCENRPCSHLVVIRETPV